MSVYRAARDAVQAVWTANWPVANAAVPIRWHSNTEEQIPDVATVSHWLHLSVEFSEERITGFGGGRFNNDRVLSGSVVIHVFAARGAGEDTALNLISDAMTTFRSRRDGPLSFIGDSLLPETGASEDGNWWMRSAIAVFEYRFQG